MDGGLLNKDEVSKSMHVSSPNSQNGTSLAGGSAVAAFPALPAGFPAAAAWPPIAWSRKLDLVARSRPARPEPFVVLEPSHWGSARLGRACLAGPLLVYAARPHQPGVCLEVSRRHADRAVGTKPC